MAPVKRTALDWLLRSTLAIARRLDPAVTGLHVVRCERIGKGATGLQMFTDECVAPGQGWIGDNLPTHGVHDIPAAPKSTVRMWPIA